VLPSSRNARGTAWQTGPWFLRNETCYLIPGDSPIGLRLPLESIPWVSKSDYPWQYPVDPLDRLADLPEPDASKPLAALTLGPDAKPDAVEGAPAPVESADWGVHTALCVESREGKLHVFMPPVRTTEDYLELIAAVEKTAAALKLPVVVEGTPPPWDSRLNNIKVTPDPGVIEVNLHPAANWDELAANTTALYEEARQSRLGSEKFMIDGRHTGTGGGTHILLGAEAPADSRATTGGFSRPAQAVPEKRIRASHTLNQRQNGRHGSVISARTRNPAVRGQFHGQQLDGARALYPPRARPSALPVCGGGLRRAPEL